MIYETYIYSVIVTCDMKKMKLHASSISKEIMIPQFVLVLLDASDH